MIGIRWSLPQSFRLLWTILRENKITVFSIIFRPWVWFKWVIMDWVRSQWNLLVQLQWNLHTSITTLVWNFQTPLRPSRSGAHDARAPKKAVRPSLWLDFAVAAHTPSARSPGVQGRTEGIAHEESGNFLVVPNSISLQQTLNHLTIENSLENYLGNEFIWGHQKKKKHCFLSFSSLEYYPPVWKRNHGLRANVSVCEHVMFM